MQERSELARGGFNNMIERANRSTLVLSAVLGLVLPIGAQAQLAVVTKADGHYESNSNVYDLQYGFQPQGAPNYDRSDSTYGYGGEIDLQYGWSLQEFYASVSGNKFTYDRFTDLDHTDYKLRGGWNWDLDQYLKGNFDILRTHSMVPFLDLVQPAFSEETEQRETARIEFPFAHDWRLDGTGVLRTVDEPLPEAPDLTLREASAIAALKYLGRAAVTTGIEATYLNGDYTGAAATNNPSYHQSSAAVTASYAATARSSFLGLAGYTRRTSVTGWN